MLLTFNISKSEEKNSEENNKSNLNTKKNFKFQILLLFYFIKCHHLKVAFTFSISVRCQKEKI